LVNFTNGQFLLNVRAMHISEKNMLTIASQEGGVYEMFVGSRAPEGD
jgi:hypothetical protein